MADRRVLRLECAAETIDSLVAATVELPLSCQACSTREQLTLVKKSDGILEFVGGYCSNFWTSDSVDVEFIQPQDAYI